MPEVALCTTSVVQVQKNELAQRKTIFSFSALLLASLCFPYQGLLPLAMWVPVCNDTSPAATQQDPMGRALSLAQSLHQVLPCPAHNEASPHWPKELHPLELHEQQAPDLIARAEACPSSIPEVPLENSVFGQAPAKQGSTGHISHKSTAPPLPLTLPPLTASLKARLCFRADHKTPVYFCRFPLHICKT